MHLDKMQKIHIRSLLELILQLDKVYAAEEEEQMGCVEREGCTPKVAFNHVLRVAPVRELLQSTIEDEVLTSSEAKYVIAEPDKLPKVDALAKDLVSLLEGLLAAWLVCIELCFEWLVLVILLVDADVVE